MKISHVIFSRVRYFSGQFLTANDFQAEQSYLRDKHRFLNRFTYGAGIVFGLSVSIEDGGRSLHISPGLAFDGLGREICVPTPVNCSLPKEGSRLRVSVRYTEADATPTPVSHGAHAGEESGHEHTRVDEGFELAVEPVSVAKAVRRPPDVSLSRDSNDGILLALLRLKGMRWVVDPSLRHAAAQHPGAKSKSGHRRRR